MENPEVKCPLCPVCDSEPLFPINPALAQAFCSNDDCLVLTWQPWESREKNLLDAAPVTITEKPATKDETNG